MRAILEFNLPEDRQEHNAAVHGMDWALVCWELDQEIRKFLKYGNDFKSADEALEDIRRTLHNLIEESGLNLEETIS
jgi:hypothetical protein